MKTFTAILAAGSILLGYLRVQSNLDQWHAAIADCNRRIGIGFSINKDQLSDAEFKSSAEIMADLREAKRTDAHIIDIYREKKSLLEHKPYDLPLNEDEKASLVFCDKAVAQLSAPITQEPSNPQKLAAPTPEPRGAWMWKNRNNPLDQPAWR